MRDAIVTALSTHLLKCNVGLMLLIIALVAGGWSLLTAACISIAWLARGETNAMTIAVLTVLWSLWSPSMFLVLLVVPALSATLALVQGRSSISSTLLVAGVALATSAQVAAFSGAPLDATMYSYIFAATVLSSAYLLAYGQGRLPITTSALALLPKVVTLLALQAAVPAWLAIALSLALAAALSRPPMLAIVYASAYTTLSRGAVSWSGAYLEGDGIVLYTIITIALISMLDCESSLADLSARAACCSCWAGVPINAIGILKLASQMLIGTIASAWGIILMQASFIAFTILISWWAIAHRLDWNVVTNNFWLYKIILGAKSIIRKNSI